MFVIVAVLAWWGLLFYQLGKINANIRQVEREIEAVWAEDRRLAAEYNAKHQPPQ